MNGPIAQLVAIALHGSGSLSGFPASDGFTERNSTAQFCESVRFVQAERSWFGFGKASEVEVARSPEIWFRFLKDRGAKRIQVQWQASGDARTPDRMLAGFVGGGGVWALNVEFKDCHVERWMAKWEVGDQKRADRKIWRVTYVCTFSGTEPLPAPLSEDQAREKLKSALDHIHQFSTRMRCAPFTENFENGLYALKHDLAVNVYHRDLSPDGFLTPGAEDLLRACQCAWVFGGMGSWNDMGFEGQDGVEYSRVSEQLFGAVTAAIPAAVASNKVH